MDHLLGPSPWTKEDIPPGTTWTANRIEPFGDVLIVTFEDVPGIWKLEEVL